MEAKDSAVEMCTLLSVKNSRAFSISVQSTQDGGAEVARRYSRATSGSPSGSGAPAVETYRIRVLNFPTSPRANRVATTVSASLSPDSRRASSDDWL